MFSPFSSLTTITADHQRNVPAKDVNGGDVAAWVVIHAGIKVSIQPIDTALVNDYAKRDIVVTDEITALVDLDARPQDRITVGTVYYLVQGLAPELNVGVFTHPIYIMHCQRRFN